ncbi:hypothetical protein ACWOFR_06115 [Carnobacterium gallinarum]|uniref:hypothetical protein n=1 Tax=Carnobacterium gallinarum TaxID=2749 RepID=UPI00055745E1|nr:hypothetical protein [Carnobacterium gallinarum]
MDTIREKLYQKSQIINKVLIRNGYLLFSYIKIRALVLFLLSVLLIIVAKNSQLDGLSSVLYGVESELERKSFPMMWLFILIVPILIIGNAQEILLKKDYPIISRSSLTTYFFTTIYLSFLLDLVFFIVLIVANQFNIKQPIFFSYVFLFTLVVLITFQIISSIIGDSFLMMLLFIILITVNIYFPYSSIIDGTMLIRFDSRMVFINSLGLIIILIIVSSWGLNHMKKIDFINRGGLK